jgi:G8 domain-containing protein
MTTSSSSNKSQGAGLRSFERNQLRRLSLRQPAIWLSLIVMLVTPPMVSRARSAVPADCEVPTGAVKLSTCIGSDTDKTVIIGGASGTGACKGDAVKAYVDQSSLTMGRITVNAGSSLKLFDRTAQLPLSMSTTGIDVFGTLEIGSAACPIGTVNPATNVTITFQGAKVANCINNACPGYTKGIQAESGSTLRMYGAEGVPTTGVSWTYLGDAAGPTTYDSKHGVKRPAKSATQIVVADDVTQKPGAWQPNDWIAVAGTGFSPFETEFVQILSFGALTPGVGRVVVLSPDTPLKFYHLGSLPPTSGTSAACENGTVPASFCDTAERNYGVDERAEVALISRNIKLTADTPGTGTGNHWGGELKFLMGFKEVSIQGVELEKFGKDKLGSYPVHFHMDGDLVANKSKVLLNANSIHHSYNKCITVHSTRNLTIKNNVCARIVGHIFYEEIGDEDNIAFERNLGLGAMSNSFDVNDSFNSATNTGSKRDDLIAKYWWVGDNMVDPFNLKAGKLKYDGFRIPDTDDQSNGTAGQCFKFGDANTNLNGAFLLSKNPVPPCQANDYYLEPPSGFWIVNPSAKLIDNSIGGCQGEGKGYWYVPPSRAGKTGDFGDKKFIPVGTYAGLGSPHGEFTNNRVHGCDAGLYSGDQQDITAEALQPYQNGVKSSTSHPVAGEFTGVVATRNRNRGVWLRPNFYTVKDARLATNRDGVSLVTSGGPDGNYPGIYSLFKDSVVVGVSQNNVDRFGPCPETRGVPGFGQIGGNAWGCIDRTSAKKGQQGTGGDLIGNGYAQGTWNFAGYMIYDGPALIFSDRFVNFKVDPTNLLTTDDAKFLNVGIPNGVYEGDAALGWYQGNISSYPTATASEKLIWDNVDFRHQVYTQQVNISAFNDGDKNTAIIDLDGTLSRYKVTPTSDSALAGKLHPISLNNLELNAAGGDSGGSVDECQSTGKQDVKLEARPSANMSPGEAGALEFEALFPDPPAPDAPVDDKRHEQKISFTKDSTEFSGTLLEHPVMTLAGRDGQGVWEPKVQNGYGYTITASAGIPSVVDVGLADVVKPDISEATPFYARIGICYQGTGTNAQNGHPKDGFFTVTRGYRSWGGGGVDPADQPLRNYYNQLDGQANQLTKAEACFNLDHQNYVRNKNCPSVGVFPMLNDKCPAAADEQDAARKLCIYSKKDLSKANSISELTSGGTPVLDKYFYDSSTGWLFFNVAQVRPNAVGPSPLGSCTGASTDPYFCPSKTGGDSYYVCPAEGCWTYGIKLNDPTWAPLASNCPDPYAKYGTPPTPALDGTLASVSNGTAVKRVQDGGLNGKFPHYKPIAEPSDCVTP